MALPEALRNALRIPVTGAPMVIVSVPDLVIAQCKAGIVGGMHDVPAVNDLVLRMQQEYKDARGRLGVG